MIRGRTDLEQVHSDSGNHSGGNTLQAATPGHRQNHRLPQMLYKQGSYRDWPIYALWLQDQNVFFLNSPGVWKLNARMIGRFGSPVVLLTWKGCGLFVAVTWAKFYMTRLFPAR